MNRGKYVVIEGHDGTGKSTQVTLLRETLHKAGIESIEFHEPEGIPIANEIRTIIKNGTLPRDAKTNLLLFTAARHELWNHAQHAIDRGLWVIASRNYYSTLAYQGYGEGLDIDVILQTTATFTDDLYMHPDLAVILSLDNEAERSQRITRRGQHAAPDTFESRDAVFQAAVQSGYLAIAHDYSLPVISASQPKEVIAAAIYKLLERPV
jgi:dTMP kinase